ncbi:probable kinetochore protein nuf2 [Coccomyxa sp. Obi]|nr:probable kinetochore protein nuf2 [Coccomyxa sp. Obi]
MDLQLSAASLAKPTPEVVKPLYETIVTTLMGITREEQQLPVFMATDTLEFPELHDESIPYMTFFRNCTKLLAAAGVHDFNMQDLCKPDPGRLRRNLSAVVNFTKFREEKLGPWTELQDEVDALLDEEQLLEQTNRALREELRLLQEERDAQMQEAAAVEAETQKVFAENQSLNKQQGALNAEVRALKQQANALADNAAEVKFSLQSAQQEGDELRGLIVESPEKLQARMGEIAAAIERERSGVADAERHLRDLQTRLDTIGKVEKDVNKAIALMEEVETEIGRKKEASRRVKALREAIASAKHEAAQLTAEQQHLRRQQSSLQDRIQRLQQNWEVRKEAALSAIVGQQKEKEAVEAENAANSAKLAENRAHERQLKKSIEEVRESHKVQMDAILDKYNSLLAQVKDYHVQLEQAMGITAATSALKAVQIR